MHLKSKRIRWATGIAVVGLLAPMLAGCASAKELCPDLEKLSAKITSPPTYTELDDAIDLLKEAQDAGDKALEADATTAIRDAQAVKDAMGKKNNLAQADRLLETLQEDLNGISGDCSEIVGGGGDTNVNVNAN